MESAVHANRSYAKRWRTKALPRQAKDADMRANARKLKDEISSMALGCSSGTVEASDEFMNRIRAQMQWRSEF